MSERGKVILAFTFIVIYVLWRFRSLYILIKRKKPEFGLRKGLEAAIVIFACTMYWKWSVGFPWSDAPIFALAVAAGVGIVFLFAYLLHRRDTGDED